MLTNKILNLAKKMRWRWIFTTMTKGDMHGMASGSKIGTVLTASGEEAAWAVASRMYLFGRLILHSLESVRRHAKEHLRMVS